MFEAGGEVGCGAAVVAAGPPHAASTSDSIVMTAIALISRLFMMVSSKVDERRNGGYLLRNAL
jgi:hypothetical protein